MEETVAFDRTPARQRKGISLSTAKQKSQQAEDKFQKAGYKYFLDKVNKLISAAPYP